MSPDSGPQFGDLILHNCSGTPRLWMEAGWKGRCSGCGEQVAGDCPYVKGHAFYRCPVCRKTVGLCAGPLLADVVEAARLVIAGGRKKEGR